MDNKFDKQLIQASKLKDKVELSKWFRSIPYYAQKVFSRKGGFKNYDVSYDDEYQIEYLNKRASVCDVIINNGKPIDINNSTETCSGQLLNCFIYLIEYLKADDGYHGAISMYIDLLYFPMSTGQYFTPYGRPFGALDVDATKTFINDGDVSVGMNIKITALEDVENPYIACSTGEQNGWFMWLNLTLQQNDEVEINTVRGNKYIKINGSTTYNGQPILSYLNFNGNDWLQLETGENTFNVGQYIDGHPQVSDNVYFTITYRRRYE